MNPRVPPSADFDEFFAGVTGAEEPYGYQRRVRHHLERGQHVLLTAPTGCGKTWATIAPFLFGRARRSPIADRLFYALPLRALAASLKREVAARCGAAGLDVNVTIQTGAQSDDELFDRGEIIFTTIDQLLSAYIHMPVSLPSRLANLNAGALVGSVIVFDEAHLLEAQTARRTMVHILRHLQGLAQVVIATATLTTDARRQIVTAFPRMVEEGPTDAEAASIPVLATKTRRWAREDRPLSASDVRAVHDGRRTLCVVNSVDQAQAIGAELLASPPMGATVRVLHARFLPEDRARIEAELAPMLGPDATRSNVVLVATQVVEAGLDLSADRLLTELAPANALVQRAGRCARYKAPRHEGDVHVFEPRSNDAGSWRMGPYRADAVVVHRTWEALAGLRGSALDLAGERALVDDAVGEAEASDWRALLSGEGLRSADDEVRDAWAEGDKSALRMLVRDVQAVSVFSTNQCDAIDLRRGPLSISLAMPTWRGFLKNLEESGQLAGISKVAEQTSAVAENPQDIHWEWLPLADVRDFALAYAVPGTLASYRADLGLVLGQPGPCAPLLYRERPAGLAIHYACETYAEHVARIVSQARSWIARHPIALTRARTVFGLPNQAAEQVVLLACVLHDVAKLNNAWQRGARAWQAVKVQRDPTAHALPAEPLAHTDFNPGTDREEERGPSFARPPHAVEGALSSIETLDAAIGALDLDEPRHTALRRIAVTAIARHHSPRAFRHGDFSLVRGAAESVRASLALVGLAREVRLPERPTPAHRVDLERDLLDPRDPQVGPKWWILYGLVVRALRLSDQAATRSACAGSRHEERL